MNDDYELLRDYVERGSEDAFRSLVLRHTGLVHAAATRILHNPALAEDVAQAVFLLLARKASGFGSRTIIAGWLYRTTRYVALQARRSEARRLSHEQTGMNFNNDPATSTWEQVSPLLEEAMDALGTTDRNAVVLRFLEAKSFIEVGSALGTSEAAAKMRVARALDKLRGKFARRGMPVTSGALLSALTAHGVTSPPVSLASRLAADALAGNSCGPGQVAGDLVTETLQMLMWNKLRLISIYSALTLLVGGGAMLLIHYASNPAPAQPRLMSTLEPLAGEWTGAIAIHAGPDTPLRSQPCSLIVQTSRQGRSCEMELKLEGIDGQPAQIHHYSHTLNRDGDQMYTISDPLSGRGNGNGIVLESFHNPGTKEWRLALRFPLPDNRGVMEGRWQRRGDQLVIISHDEFFRRRGSDHFYAELHLNRAVHDARF